MATQDSVRNVHYLYDQFGKIRAVEFYLQKDSKRIFFDIDRIIVRENDVIEYKLNLYQESDQYNQIIYLYFKNSKVLLLNNKVHIFYGHFKVYFYAILCSLFLIWWMYFSFRFFEQLIYDGMIFWKDAIFLPLDVEFIFIPFCFGILLPLLMVFMYYKDYGYINFRKFIKAQDKNHNDYEYHLNIFDQDKNIFFWGETINNGILQLKARQSKT